MRACPNCHALVFVVFEIKAGNSLIVTYPPEVFDFDPDGLPESVVDCLEEAVKCHAAGCYRAAGMMIRRTLEEVCALHNADGPNLQKRLEALAAQVAVPSTVVAGLTELRFLGNDAAHVEVRKFEQVDKAEIDVALEVVQIVLQAVYQFEGVVQRLQALKAKPES